jgi:DNA end-binding protein Ku
MAQAKVRRPSNPAFHPFWSGTIAFGLVSVPVELYPANRNTRPRLRLLDQDGTPVHRRYYCPKHRRDVHPEHIVRGYELGNGEYVVIHDSELESLEPKKSREIDLRQFVERDEISPRYFERAYYLTPSGESSKAYRLLADVIEHSGLAGIATFVMRDREYLIAILAERGILEAVTLRFHDELRTAEDVGLTSGGKPSASAVTAYARSIQSHSAGELPLDDMSDDYGNLLRGLIRRKYKRRDDVVQVVMEEEGELEEYEPGSENLLETIRRSLHPNNGRASRKRRPKKR